MSPDAGIDGPDQFLTVVIARQPCAISVLGVTEVIGWVPVTRVPRTPEWVLGVLNLRGSVVPVIDLGLRFGLPRSELSSRTCVVVTERRVDEERHVIGLLADAVDKVVDVPPAGVQPPPSFGCRIPVEYLVGLARADGKLVPILDVSRILADTGRAGRCGPGEVTVLAAAAGSRELPAS